MLDINGRPEAAHVFGDIVAEDDATHGGFARATLAHQEDFLFLWFLERIHDAKWM